MHCLFSHCRADICVLQSYQVDLYQIWLYRLFLESSVGLTRGLTGSWNGALSAWQYNSRDNFSHLCREQNKGKWVSWTWAASQQNFSREEFRVKKKLELIFSLNCKIKAHCWFCTTAHPLVLVRQRVRHLDCPTGVHVLTVIALHRLPICSAQRTHPITSVTQTKSLVFYTLDIKKRYKYT